MMLNRSLNIRSEHLTNLYSMGHLFSSDWLKWMTFMKKINSVSFNEFIFYFTSAGPPWNKNWQKYSDCCDIKNEVSPVDFFYHSGPVSELLFLLVTAEQTYCFPNLSQFIWDLFKTKGHLCQLVAASLQKFCFYILKKVINKFRPLTATTFDTMVCFHCDWNKRVFY